MTRPRIYEWPYADSDPKYRRLDVFPHKGIPPWLGWLLFVIGVGVVDVCLEGGPVSDKRNFAGAVHLSQVINEELAERGWTLRDLVFRMRRYESEKDWGIEMLAMEMFMVVHEKNVMLDQKTADGLGTAFDISPQFFINFHEAWRAKQP